jgi:hypothetical protein
MSQSHFVKVEEAVGKPHSEARQGMSEMLNESTVTVRVIGTPNGRTQPSKSTANRELLTTAAIVVAAMITPGAVAVALKGRELKRMVGVPTRGGATPRHLSTRVSSPN